AFRRRVGGLDQSIRAENQDSRRKIRKHRLAEILADTRPLLLRLRLHLQLMLLLFKLLDDRVVEIQRQSLKRCRASIRQVGLFGNVLTKCADEHDAKQERES